jgi:hypothetical protein
MNLMLKVGGVPSRRWWLNQARNPETVVLAIMGIMLIVLIGVGADLLF